MVRSNERYVSLFVFDPLIGRYLLTYYLLEAKAGITCTYTPELYKAQTSLATGYSVCMKRGKKDIKATIYPNNIQHPSRQTQATVSK